MFCLVILTDCTQTVFCLSVKIIVPLKHVRQSTQPRNKQPEFAYVQTFNTQTNADKIELGKGGTLRGFNCGSSNFFVL